MTNASSIAADPQVTSQNLSTRWRVGVLAAFIGFNFLVVFATPILTDEAGILAFALKPNNDWWNQFDEYWLNGCAILIAGWVALGPGRMGVRALHGMIAGSWLLLAWLFGLTMSPNWKYGVEGTTLGCVAIGAVTLVILILFRRCSGRMLVLGDGTNDKGTSRFQYSLATLLLTMLLIGITLGLLGRVDPRYRNYAAQWQAVQSQAEGLWQYAAYRRVLLEKVRNEALGLAFFAAACLPAFLSRRKRSFVWTLGLSAAVVIVIFVADDVEQTFLRIPLLRGNPLVWWGLSYYLEHGVASLAAVTACLLTAATAMHWLGYRIAAVDGREMRAGTLL